MDSTLIFMGIFLGIAAGVGGGYLILFIKGKLERKHILKKIEKQDAKMGANKAPLNFHNEVLVEDTPPIPEAVEEQVKAREKSKQKVKKKPKTKVKKKVVKKK